MLYVSIVVHFASKLLNMTISLVWSSNVMDPLRVAFDEYFSILFELSTNIIKSSLKIGLLVFESNKRNWSHIPRFKFKCDEFRAKLK